MKNKKWTKKQVATWRKKFSAALVELKRLSPAAHRQFVGDLLGEADQIEAEREGLTP